MIKEFKEFVMKGNVLDMAIGVIVGGAFGKIVSSVVNDVFMPLIGMIVGGVNFTDLKIVLSPAVVDSAGEVIAQENAILYGNFLQTLFDFLIIALVIFMVVKTINKLKKPKPVTEAAAPVTSEMLLTEIRDLLKNNNK